MMFKKVSIYVVGASLVVAAAGCGKKSSSSDEATGLSTDEVAKLELTSELVLLPAQNSSGTALTLDESTFNVSSSDGTVRKLKLRVNSDAFEAAESVGNILCYFSQTNFWKQVGQGPYQVLVDTTKCEENKGDSGAAEEGGSSSSNTSKSYITAFAESKLDGTNVLAKIRFVMEKDGESQEYHADIKVTEKPGDVYPIGLFEMFFTGYNKGVNGGGGHIKATKGATDGKFVIDYMENTKEGSRTNSTQLMAELEKSGTDFIGKFNSKAASVETQGSRKYEYKVAFDKNFAKVAGSVVSTYSGGGGGGGSNASDPTGCYDRKSYVTAIYQYDLASADGTLKELKTGFQIEATIAGKPAQGFAGYGGVGFNDQSLSSKLANRDKVNKVSYVDKARVLTPYTVVRAPGKLTKFTRAATTLGALKGMDLSYNDAGKNYIIRWDGSAFNKVSSVTYGNQGPVEVAATGVVTAQQWGMFLFVQNLNAGIKIPYGTLTDASILGYHKEEIVNSSANAPTEAMVCYESCPKMAPTAAELKRTQGGSPSGNCPMVQSGAFKTQSITMNGNTCTVAGTQSLSGTAMASYTFSATTLNLSEGTTAFALPDLSAVSQNEANNYGYRSGALIPATTYAALSAATKAKWPGGAEMDIESFYRWESGASSWSQYTALKDAAGTIATFDKPLDLSYTHSTANDFDGNGTYDGKSFRLSYGGPGQLWGIPMKYNSSLLRGAPMFAIKAGVAVGDYKVYPANGEQYMKKAASDASCAALSTDSVPALPTAVDAKAAAVLVDIGGATPATSTLELRYIGAEAPVK